MVQIEVWRSEIWRAIRIIGVRIVPDPLEAIMPDECPLSGVMRTLIGPAPTFANDPKRTLGDRLRRTFERCVAAVVGV